MDSNKDYSKNKMYYSAYIPFHKECYHCLFIDFAVVFAMVIGAMFISTKGFDNRVLWVGTCVIAVFYLLIEVFINYRLSILARVEKRFNLIVCEALQYEDICEEFSLSGRWGSILPKLYPKELNVARFRVKMRDQCGNPISLRCAASGSQWKQKTFHETLFVHVIYGKYSHIILSWEGVHLRKVSGLYDKSFIEGPTVNVDSCN